jgi:hypothetical protein
MSDGHSGDRAKVIDSRQASRFNDYYLKKS